MRNANKGSDLPSIPFKLIDEEPIVEEVTWDEWDHAVRLIDAPTPEGRALALMEMPA